MAYGFESASPGLIWYLNIGSRLKGIVQVVFGFGVVLAIFEAQDEQRVFIQIVQLFLCFAVLPDAAFDELV